MSAFDEGEFKDGGPATRSRNRPHGNLNALRVAVLCLFGILGVRLAWMQLIDGASYAQRSKENHIIQTNILPPRGLIFDRNGAPLVDNTPIYTASVVPDLLPSSSDTRYAIYNKLESIIGIPALEIQTRIDTAEQNKVGDQQLTLKDHLTSDQALMLDEASTDMPGVSLTVAPGRSYPAGMDLSNILGYTGPLFAEDASLIAQKGYQYNESIGRAGLEAQYEDQLRGQVGFTANEQDAQGNLVTALKTKDPVPGNNLKLSIDAGLQNYTYQLLSSTLVDPTWDAHIAAAVVMSPKTGQIYAMVSVPGYDNNAYENPADPANAALIQQWNADNVGHPLMNHAVSEAAPGSTFKLITASAALQTGLITPHTTWNVPSTTLEVKGENGQIYNLYDWRVQGTIDLYQAIEWSSDIYFYMASCGILGQTKALGNSNDQEKAAAILGSYARAYGLGGPTGVDLPDEADGVIPDAQQKARTHSGPGFRPEDAAWYYADTCFMGIGQGDVTATPLQIARMTAAVANGGKLLTPQLVSEIDSPDGKLIKKMQPQSKQVPVSAANLEVIREGMHLGVEQGVSATAQVPGLDIAGKTGTSEFIDYTDGLTKSHAWFTGFAPFNDPEVVVTVYYDLGVGSEKAAPAAGKILDYFFKNVKP